MLTFNVNNIQAFKIIFLPTLSHTLPHEFQIQLLTSTSVSSNFFNKQILPQDSEGKQNYLVASTTVVQPKTSKGLTLIDREERQNQNTFIKKQLSTPQLVYIFKSLM